MRICIPQAVTSTVETSVGPSPPTTAVATTAANPTASGGKANPTSSLSHRAAIHAKALDATAKAYLDHRGLSASVLAVNEGGVYKKFNGIPIVRGDCE